LVQRGRASGGHYTEHKTVERLWPSVLLLGSKATPSWSRGRCPVLVRSSGTWHREVPRAEHPSSSQISS